jgi:hypothetical protein
LPSTRGSRCVAPTVPRCASERDARHRQRLDRLVGRERLHAPLAHPGLALAGALLQVRASAEHRAVAADEHDTNAFLLGNIFDGGDERVAHLHVQGIAHLGPIERDRGDAVGDGELDRHMARFSLSLAISSEE